MKVISPVVLHTVEIKLVFFFWGGVLYSEECIPLPSSRISTLWWPRRETNTSCGGVC